MSSTRLRLLEVTRHLVAQHGAGIAMADVARAAGVSRQAVYLHFTSRASLLVAVVRQMDEQAGIHDRCRRALRHDDPVRALEAFVSEWLHYIETIHPVASALLASRRDDSDARGAWTDRMDELRTGFRHATGRLAATDRLRPGLDPGAAADLAWTMTSIPVWEQLTIECGRPSDDARRHLTEAVTHAVVRA
ncbi:TetR/AcrR family transcriptional regulator [Actinoplanes sichuanensis]|uniref:TetR/AcrR family transcriptional regulator n=1 Tax=Actinoplanes sichuanensis TaxID=512349 RepID=A0ABW4AII7_9ACTN|nr:TetR/AcrR family transcriptional regulator [Actinoplanes sichuanensis]